VGRDNEIRLDGEVLREAPRAYLAMNKPAGIDCQPRRQAGRWVGDYFPDTVPGLEPVGRLDRRSRGLLLVSNDLWWSTRITENHDLERRYEITVSRRVTGMELDVIRAGLNLPGQGFFRPLRVGILAEQDDQTRLQLTIRGGRLRQARAIFTMLRHEVTGIVSVGIGPVALERLSAGAIRELTPSEVRRLATPLGRESR
jgi:23S rRNA pseudouridine2605 synthase